MTTGIVEGVTAEQVDQIRHVAKYGHAPEELLARLRQCLRFYDLTYKAWMGCREEYTELDDRVALALEWLDTHKHAPDDGVWRARMILKGEATTEDFGGDR